MKQTAETDTVNGRDCLMYSIFNVIMKLSRLSRQLFLF